MNGEVKQAMAQQKPAVFIIVKKRLKTPCSGLLIASSASLSSIWKPVVLHRLFVFWQRENCLPILEYNEKGIASDGLAL